MVPKICKFSFPCANYHKIFFQMPKKKSAARRAHLNKVACAAARKVKHDSENAPSSKGQMAKNEKSNGEHVSSACRVGDRHGPSPQQPPNEPHAGSWNPTSERHEHLRSSHTIVQRPQQPYQMHIQPPWGTHRIGHAMDPRYPCTTPPPSFNHYHAQNHYNPPRPGLRYPNANTNMQWSMNMVGQGIQNQQVAHQRAWRPSPLIYRHDQTNHNTRQRQFDQTTVHSHTSYPRPMSTAPYHMGIRQATPRVIRPMHYTEYEMHKHAQIGQDRTKSWPGWVRPQNYSMGKGSNSDHGKDMATSSELVHHDRTVVVTGQLAMPSDNNNAPPSKKKGPSGDQKFSQQRDPRQATANQWGRKEPPVQHPSPSSTSARSSTMIRTTVPDAKIQECVASASANHSSKNKPCDKAIHLQKYALATYFTEQHNKNIKKDLTTNGKTKKDTLKTPEHTVESIKALELQRVWDNILADTGYNNPTDGSGTTQPTARPQSRKRPSDSPATSMTVSKRLRTSQSDQPRPVPSEPHDIATATTTGDDKERARKNRQRDMARARRSNAEYREQEKLKDRDRRREQKNEPASHMQKLIIRFRELAGKGPEHVCAVCNRMLYRHSVRDIGATKALKSAVSNLCTTMADGQVDSDWICHTCHRHINKGGVPPMAIANGLAFPKKPKKLNLHLLEWRLLAPRLVFMKIHQAPRGKQYKIEGNVVNVVANMPSSVNKLPRQQCDAHTIPVKLKRRLKYTHHTISQNIRPNMVNQAAKWLVQHGPLFRKEGIQLNKGVFYTIPSVLKSSKSNGKTISAEQAAVDGSEHNEVTSYRCMLDGCIQNAATLEEAEQHIRVHHEAYLFGTEAGHCIGDIESVLTKQTTPTAKDMNQYYCPVCDIEFKYEINPVLHMMNIHNLLELDSALSFHKATARSSVIHTYRIHEPEQVATISWADDKETKFPTWVIEMRELIMEGNRPQNSSHGVITLPNWARHDLPHNDAHEHINKTLEVMAGEYDDTKDKTDPGMANDKDSDSDSEPTGATDTMLTEADYVETSELKKVRDFAPGENNVPRSIFLDRHCEELAYPDIFLGHARQQNPHGLVDYSDIVKSELLRVDRRAAMNVENLFFKTKKLQMKLLTGRTQLALRQHKTADMTISAGTLKNPEAIKKIIQHDQGYQFLATLRGSPPYFKKAKQDLFAMIRQLGPATFFISLSAAETKWIHLLRILGKTVDGVDYSDEDLQTMGWDHQCRLIQSDPITCARHFDYQLHTFIAKFLKSPHAPIGTILDMFHRVEMQHRGSCHVHMVVWIEGAPRLDSSSPEEITKFIDKYITCKRPVEGDLEMEEMVSRQMHTHTKTCKKNPGSKCRFNYPQPPFPETVILDPIPDTDPRHNELKTTWDLIHAELETMARGTEMTFNDFLAKMEITYTTYRESVQCTLRARTVFLRRSPQEITINNYNTDMIAAWQANMDIQFVLDAYACATYIVAYISKGSRGMSKLLVRAAAEVRTGNTDVLESMRHIGNKFLNSVEISAQEAAYLALQLSLRKASRSIVFIPTSPPEERVRLLKKQADIAEMDDGDTNIDSSNLLKRYSTRPSNMEAMPLAEWAAWYDVYVKKDKKDDPVEDVDGTPVQDQRIIHEENDEDLPLYEGEVPDKRGRRRRKARIIRCPWFDVKVKEDHHYRELITLFVPWRNETTDILGGYESCKDHYMAKREIINNRLDEYSPGRKEVEEAIAQQAAEAVQRQEAAAVAPSAQHNDENDQAKPSKTNDPTLKPNYDIGRDMDIEPGAGIAYEELQHNRQTDTQFRESVRMLNPKQRCFFDYITNVVRTKKEQIFAFLSGGAGVGKSHLSKAIYQHLLKLYSTEAGDDAETLRILVMAPTGKAAHIIKGLTIHSALRAPFNNVGQDYRPLAISSLNTVRASMGGLKFIMIDEISMVGNNLLNFVDRRLQDIMGVGKPFGGLHILCIGDLFQLQPVMDPWVFQLPKEGIRSLATNVWKENFKMFELTTIMRQRDYKPFAELLNRLREGHQTEADKAFLLSRVTDKDCTEPDYPHKAVTHLYCRNRDVESFNNVARKNPPTHIIADDHVNGTCNEEMERIHLQRLKEKPTKDTHGLASVLTIALEDRIEISQNIRVKDGLTNGAAGQVMKIPQPADNTDSMIVDGIVWILFDEEDIGMETRAKNKKRYERDIQQSWTPITPEMKKMQISSRTSITATRTQFPIRISAAKTIHRSQGQTLPEVAADFRAAKGAHMHYVAISRVTNPKKLYISNPNLGAIRTDPHVRDEMARLRTEGKINIPRQLRYVPSATNIVACYMNIQSYNKYGPDLVEDYNHRCSYITMVAETNATEHTTFDHFQEKHPHQVHNNKHHCAADPPARHGISCFATHALSNVTITNTASMECISCTTTYPDKCTYICVYRYHRKPMRDFFEDLNKVLNNHRREKLVVAGDINLNIDKEVISKAITDKVLAPNKLRYIKTGPTYKAGSTIDHIYTNIDRASATVVHTYYSDHDLIVVKTI